MKTQWPHQEALAVADELCDALRPITQCCHIAGSLRRGKDTVGDIEIVYIPVLIPVAGGDMFTQLVEDVAASAINAMVQAGKITKRLNINGQQTWGPHNKLAVHCTSGIPIDFFATTEENWWVAFVIRTGSKETNLALTTGAQKLGRKLNAYGCGVTCSDGSVIQAVSEQHVFELCGVPYREPNER